MKTKSSLPATALAHESLFGDDGERKEPRVGHSWIKLASALDDYLDEEVVDGQGNRLGTLACYWEDGDRRLVFCGVKVNGGEEVHVAPGDETQISERYSWVRLACPASKVVTAPIYDCEKELDAALERAVYEHYG